MDLCKTKFIRLLVAPIFQRNWSPKRVFREAKFFSGPGCISCPTTDHLRQITRPSILAMNGRAVAGQLAQVMSHRAIQVALVASILK